MGFEIISIRYLGRIKKPLLVVCRLANGSNVSFQTTARNLETFALFRRMVANRFGIWLRIEQQHSDMIQDIVWEMMINKAFGVRKT